MAYVTGNYANNEKGPVGKWCCAPNSKLGPFTEAPIEYKSGPNYCGQCVSYVRQVCPSLPPTGSWKKGELVKDAKDVKPGTVIATFNENGHYHGHAAIFVSKSAAGIFVYDQWVNGKPRAVKSRTLRYGASGNSNNGDNFYIVE